MMVLSAFRNSSSAVHFIGCGGVGTAPLMRIFSEKGFRVSGSDLIENNAVCQLRELGLTVFTGTHDASHLPDAEHLLVVCTSAANDANPEIAEARKRGARLMRRGEALAELASLYPRPVAVSGSHGKTSVTAMIVWTLKQLGVNPGYLIGGKINGDSVTGCAGDGTFFITEGDESDGTNALLRTELAVVTNLDDDHVWSLGGTDVLERNFHTFAAGARHLVFNAGERTDRLFADHPDAVRLEPADSLFPPEIEKSMGGFQIANSHTAAQALKVLGFPMEKTLPLLAHFPGADRRMCLRYDSSPLRIVEDYAHHPAELRESIAALRKINPGRRLVVIFQPHRYARLERYFSDFVRELSKADEVFVTPVFAAWTSGGKYSSDDLAHALACPACAVAGSWEKIAREVRTHLREGDLAAVIGAGDLREILPFLIPSGTN